MGYDSKTKDSIQVKQGMKVWWRVMCSQLTIYCFQMSVYEISSTIY